MLKYYKKIFIINQKNIIFSFLKIIYKKYKKERKFRIVEKIYLHIHGR